MAAPLATSLDAASAGGATVDSLWLATLQRIVGRGAHEVKGALNGVAVNLEVVRSRSEKPDAAASAVRSFATAAADQLDGVIEMTEALLALARPVRLPAEVGRILRSVGSLLIPAAHADGRELLFEGQLDASGTTSADGSVVRLMIAAALLAAIEGATRVVCRAMSNGGASIVRIEYADGVAPAIADDVIAVARNTGIQVQAESSAISITFPR